MGFYAAFVRYITTRPAHLKHWAVTTIILLAVVALLACHLLRLLVGRNEI